jgi:transcriptional antiterminator RfaH
VTLPQLMTGQSWHVAFTQPNCEMRALRHLRNQKFPAYVPRFLKRAYKGRRIERRPAPLFPRYIFVGFDVDRQRWRSVNGTIGVTHLICHGDRPAPIDESIINAIAQREGEDGLVRLSIAPSFIPGQPVRVTEGVFAEQLCLYEGVGDRERVRILLNLLGRKVRVLIESELVVAA